MTTGKAAPNFDNTYNDPENAVKGTGVLSSPQIEYYAKRYGMIRGFDKSCLKAAVYEMRLGEIAVRWDDKLALRFHLRENVPDMDLLTRICASLPGARRLNLPDIAAKSLVLPPNSLTFASVYEKFNLPRDVIARFNLKSPFVHRGLMLGGGPIIDPGYRSGIVLPLHNFSNVPIEIAYLEPIIKVEFSRTTNPDETMLGGLEVSRLVNDRARIDDAEFFSNTRYIESSVYAAIEKNASLVKSLTTKLHVATIAGVVGMVALITAFYNLIINISNTSNNAVAKLHETQEKMTAFSARNEKFLDGVDNSLENLLLEIKRLKKGGLSPEDLDEVEKKAGELREKISLGK